MPRESRKESISSLQLTAAVGGVRRRVAAGRRARVVDTAAAGGRHSGGTRAAAAEPRAVVQPRKGFASAVESWLGITYDTGSWHPESSSIRTFS